MEYLKPIGFRKRNRNFNRVLEDGITQVINLQMWQSAPNETEIPGIRPNLMGQFTINMGVYLPLIQSTLHESSTPNFITEYACHIRTRLGELVDGRDTWYVIQLENDSLINKLIGEGFNWFENFSSYQRIMDYFESTGHLDFNPSDRSKLLVAIIYNHFGKKKRAEELLNSAYESSHGHPFQSYLAKQANKLGVQLG